MYIGRLEPVTKLKTSDRKYQKRHTKDSESKTSNHLQKQIKQNPTNQYALAPQTMFDVTMLNTRSEYE